MSRIKDVKGEIGRSKFEIIPERTALLIIDIQNDTSHPDGARAKHGYEMKYYYAIVPRVKRLIDVCRKAGIPIIYSKSVRRADGKDLGLAGVFRPFMKKKVTKVKDTWGSAIIDELKPEPNDWIVEKNRLSVFYQTNMDLIVKSLNVDTLLVTGTATNMCVESTIRDCHMRDIKAVCVEDCCGARHKDMHEAALRNVEYGLGMVKTSDEVIDDILKKVK